MADNIPPDNENEAVRQLRAANLANEIRQPDQARAALKGLDESQLSDLDRAAYYKLVGKLETNDGRHEKARHYFERGLEVLESQSVPDRLEIERLRCWVGLMYFRQSLPTQAIEYHQEGLRRILDGSIENHELHVLLAFNLGLEYYDLGNLELSMSYLMQGLDLCIPKEDDPTKAGILYSIGNIYSSKYHDHEQGLAYLYKSIALYEGSGLRKYSVEGKITAGRALAKLGRYQEAENILKDAIPVAREYGNTYFVAHGYLHLAELYLDLRQYEQAEQAVAAGLDIGYQQENRSVIGYLWSVGGNIKLTQGLAAESLEYFDNALAIFVPRREQDNARIVYERYSRALAMLGRGDEAVEMRRRSLEANFAGKP